MESGGFRRPVPGEDDLEQAEVKLSLETDSDCDTHGKHAAALSDYKLGFPE